MDLRLRGPQRHALSSSGRQANNLAALRCARSPLGIAGCRQRAARPQHVQALLDSGPAYNKYRSRQEIEKDYYQDWERTTLLAEEERDRPMTVVTFLTFLPTWLQFYAVPGPLRFVAHLLARWAAAAAHRVHKRVVVQAAKLDVLLLRRAGVAPAAPSRKLALLRLHGRVPLAENLRHWLALARGRTHEVAPTPAVVATYTPGPESQRLPADQYDATLDPWQAA